MILLNLLPHREMARKRARQVFNGSLVGAVAMGLSIPSGAREAFPFSSAGSTPNGWM